ncbi:MAG: adenylate/guanylate cyclase domain-containing protein [Pseudomonadota bacterium]
MVDNDELNQRGKLILSAVRRKKSGDGQTKTRYAKSGGCSIAYQVIGDGDIDLLFVPGWVSHVEYGWEVPSYAAFLKRLSSFARLIVMDRRGTGFSDHMEGMPTLEQRIEDVRAVLDATASEQAFLFGLSEGGPMCSLFAATYPERTAGLVLYGTTPRVLAGEDFPFGAKPVELQLLLRAIDSDWGSGLTAAIFAPSVTDNDEMFEQWARFERYAVSPGGMRSLIEILGETDVREILPMISAPTLVIHRRDDPVISVEGGRYLAEHITGARFVELAGVDHFAWVGNTDLVLDEIQEFVTGKPHVPVNDRVLATVCFVDIVSSTETAAALGDAQWRDVLSGFRDMSGAVLEAHEGIEIDRAGDGLFARFDGPARAIRCALAIRGGAKRQGLDVRSGVHVGECEVLDSGLAGIAVHTGARIASAAEPGEILVSNTVKDLVAGSRLHFDPRGAFNLKGVPERRELYAVADARS